METRQGYVLIFVSSILLSSCLAQDWNYGRNNGPDQWSTEFQSCVGHRQSPVMISADEVHEMDMPALKLSNYETLQANMKITNNGHTVEIDLENNDISLPPQVDGAFFTGHYIFKQFHFHWASRDSSGSEHELAHHAFPLEMHLVHTLNGISMADATAAKQNSIAVLAVLFKIRTQDNPSLEPLVRRFADVEYRGDSTILADGFRLSSLLPHSIENFYTYEGSLTTPPCAEDVIWIVFNKTVPVSERQLDQFRSLRRSTRSEFPQHFITHNHRPPQVLEGRPIYMRKDAAAIRPIFLNTLLVALALMWQLFTR